MYVSCQRFVWKHKEAWLLIPLSFETCEETSILKLGQLVYMMSILKSDKDWLVILHDMPRYVAICYKSCNGICQTYTNGAFQCYFGSYSGMNCNRLRAWFVSSTEKRAQSERVVFKSWMMNLFKWWTRWPCCFYNLKSRFAFFIIPAHLTVPSTCKKTHHLLTLYVSNTHEQNAKLLSPITYLLATQCVFSCLYNLTAFPKSNFVSHLGAH